MNLSSKLYFPKDLNIFGLFSSCSLATNFFAILNFSLREKTSN